MTSPDTRKFLFDTYGYLVVDDVLNADDLAELNRIIDEQGVTATDGETRQGQLPGGGAGEVGAGFLEWGTEFCDLLDHPKVMPALRLVLGDGFRLDHFWGAYANAGAPAIRRDRDPSRENAEPPGRHSPWCSPRET